MFRVGSCAAVYTRGTAECDGVLQGAVRALLASQDPASSVRLRTTAGLAGSARIGPRTPRSHATIGRQGVGEGVRFRERTGSLVIQTI